MKKEIDRITRMKRSCEMSGWTLADDSIVLGILDRCGFSEEMMEYLIKEHAVSIHCCVEIIGNAPCSIEDKKIMLLALQNAMGIYVSNEIRKAYQEVKHAEDRL